MMGSMWHGPALAPPLDAMADFDGFLSQIDVSSSDTMLP
jgi:hypothetical protein